MAKTASERNDQPAARAIALAGSGILVAKKQTTLTQGVNITKYFKVDCKPKKRLEHGVAPLGTHDGLGDMSKAGVMKTQAKCLSLLVLSDFCSAKKPLFSPALQCDLVSRSLKR
ncbi:hypothetical protein [Halopseudomonas sp.]|uniref:hypothetical protein n=1 Tax=Halopseudomonas sp. TaxID=2901191 RepID=UPI0030014F2B